jgi:uncharacterized protein
MLLPFFPRFPRIRRSTLRGVAACALLLAAPAGSGAAAVRLSPIADHRPVCIRGSCFESEIAVTEAERAQGLMFRDVLPPDRGMLFVFPEEGLHRFWMKNTRIALDIIFIGSDRRVVGIVNRAQPCRKEPCDTYGPAAKAAYALEIGAGLAAARGFASGDLVEIREAPTVR